MGLKRTLTILIIIALSLFTYAGRAQKTSVDFLRYAIEATENKDYTGAIVLCEHSLALEGNNELAYYHRGFNRLMIGDYKGAIADATKSIELNDKVADFYLLRAEARLKTGERLSAISDYNRARKLDGSITIVHFAQNLFRFVF